MKEARQRVATLEELMHLQYNVFTAQNCCRGILRGLELSLPEMSERSITRLSKAERIGFEAGTSVVADCRLMGGAGASYLEEVQKSIVPIALERIEMATAKKAHRGKKGG